MPSVEVNGVHINYVQIPCEAGDDAEDMVMIHGLATNMAFWYLSHAQAFARRYRVTLYDLRGHGRSGLTESGYRAPDMAMDLEKLLDHLCIERAHFAAHSFGGAVALNLACRAPSRFASLMLFDTQLYSLRALSGALWRFGHKVKRILSRNGLDIDVTDPFFGYRILVETARLKVSRGTIAPELDNLVSPLLGRNSTRTAAHWLHLIEKTRAEKELMENDGLTLDGLGKLSFPMLVAYGERSQTMAAGERLLEVWPHADFRRIRDSGHFFPVTCPLEFMETCRQFWNGALMNGVPLRNGDAGKRYFRSNRLYRREGMWFFDTRESAKNGPFDERAEAQKQWHFFSGIHRTDADLIATDS